MSSEELESRLLDDDIEITPWKVKGKFNNKKYQRMIKKFGVESFDEKLLERFEKVTGYAPHYWMRRGIFFAHRELDKILDDFEKKKPIFLYTGRGPTSESMHLGHMISFMFTAWLQKVLNAVVVIQMADDEKYHFKELEWNYIYKMGFENAKDIIACEFDPKKTFIYSHRDYSGSKCVLDLVNDMWKHVNVNNVQAIFGLPGNCSIGQINWPVYQSAAAFSKYYEKIFGNKENYRCLVAYAIDQDPYFRLCRDVAPKLNLYKPSAIMCTFLPALAGDEKMSSSGNAPTIFMTDDPKGIYEKVKKFAFSGGQETKELHQKLGGNLEEDVSYQYLRYFEPDDKKLEEIGKAYSSGEMLSGEIKKIMSDVVTKFVINHQEKRKKITNEIIKEFYSIDNIKL